MSRYRYLIEKASDGIYLTTITADDTSGTASHVADLDAAKELANLDPNLDGATVRWKDAPEAWQPDAVAVSQWLDDGVEDNRAA